MSTTRRVHCDALGTTVELPDSPSRIVCLNAAYTEMLAEMGHADRIAGVCCYNERYAPQVPAPVVCDYLRVDDEALRAVQPDLILAISGVQRNLARRLHGQGYPVYILPLATSLHGLLETAVQLGGLVGDPASGRALADRWGARMAELRRAAPSPRPSVYVELWLGKFARTPGPLTHIHDIVEAAGGSPLFNDIGEAYRELDLEEVVRRRPKVMVLFSEPEYPVDPVALLAERGWDRLLPGLKVIESDVRRGTNVIHEGPCMVETAEWLQRRIREVMA